MAFKEHRLEKFSRPIAALPDAPRLSAGEMKAQFDACPEELREKHNAACDEAARLDERVHSIVTDTFGDTIDREMLSHELQQELSAKAEEATVQQRLNKLAADMVAADKVLQTAINAKLAQKCEVVFGTYEGTGNKQTITLGFQPLAVIIATCDHPKGLVGTDPLFSFVLRGESNQTITIHSTGFTVDNYMNYSTFHHENANPYRYIAFRPVA